MIKQRMGFGIRMSWVQIPVQKLRMNLEKSHNPSMLQSPYL